MSRLRHHQPRLAVIGLGVVSVTVSSILTLMAAAPPIPRSIEVDDDLFATRAAIAQATGQVMPIEAWQALQDRANGSLEATWNTFKGIPEFVMPKTATGRIPYTPSATERGKPIAIAQGFMDENRALFRLRSAAEELKVLRIEPDVQLGYSHVRMAQQYRGLPVFGRQMVVHVDSDDQITAVNGQFTPDISISTEAQVSKPDAEAFAFKEMKELWLESDELSRLNAQVLPHRTQLVVYVDEKDKPTLTWMVKILASSPLSEWTFFVNARRASITHVIENKEQLRRRRTYTARNTDDIPGRLLIDEGERSNDPIAQAAHDGAGKVYDYFFNNFKRDSIDGQGMPLVSTVHYGSDPDDAENAAWIGEMKQMVYGDGGRMFRPLAYGLDVVGHEFTHGVVESTSELVYEAQAGALNESYADVFGVLISGANWEVGRGIVKSPPFPVAYLRSLSDPNANGYYDSRNPLKGVGQPAHMREYANLPVSRRADNGGVHINSGIPNHVAYKIGTALGRDKVGAIYYRALTQYLTPRAKFVDAANASIRAAQELYGANDAAAVRKAFADVGIIPGNATSDPTAPNGSSTTPQRPAPSTPAPAPLPSGCVNVVSNGGFENNDGWKQATKGGTGLFDPENPNSGQRSAWLGGQDQEPIQAIYQDISIPANASRVELSYMRYLHEEVSGLLGLFSSPARFRVVIANSSGDIVETFESLTSDQSDDRWTEKKFDLSGYAGKSLRLAFSAENPRSNVSSFFVDDVVVASCAAAASGSTGSNPSAPAPKTGDVVFIQGQVVDADTGRGISGVQVFFIKPGMSAIQAAADDRVTASEVDTYAISDDKGTFQSQAAVRKGQTYGVIIIARGYRPVVADVGTVVPANATNPHVVKATLRRAW